MACTITLPAGSTGRLHSYALWNVLLFLSATSMGRMTEEPSLESLKSGRKEIVHSGVFAELVSSGGVAWMHANLDGRVT